VEQSLGQGQADPLDQGPVDSPLLTYRKGQVTFVGPQTIVKKDKALPGARFLPNPKKLGTVKEQQHFIDLLLEVKYIRTAAKLYGCGYRTVYRRRQEFPEFDAALNALQAAQDSSDLEELEEISVVQAKDPKKTTERIFQLNALNRAKYRPTGAGGFTPNINIIVGTLQLDNRRQYLVQQGITPPAKGQRLPGVAVTKGQVAPEPIEGRQPAPLVDEDDINV